MSLLWSATDLFNIKIKLDTTTNKWKADCPATKEDGKPCLKQALMENITSLRNASTIISCHPLDDVPDHLVENLARLSLCGRHQNKRTMLADGWKGKIADKIKAEWRKSRAKLAATKANADVLEGELEQSRSSIQVKEREVEELKRELVARKRWF